MKSFSLIKTNVGLTSNVKISIDNSGNLHLDTIESNSVLSDSNFKKFAINQNSNYSENLQSFYNGLSTENVFFVTNSDDKTIMQDSFDEQLDDMYISGAKNITENKFYEEDYEYFAPLYVSKTGLPKYFMIFRLDGPGTITLTSENFKELFLNKLKCVKLIDLTTKTQLGKWLYSNITTNDSFPPCGFEIDFRDLEFSYWHGIDYTKGIWTKNPYYFNDILEFENTFHDLEKFIYDGFKNNNLIYPNILNLNFLFNDTPATPTSLRNWSINRYAGFYLDEMIYSKSFTTLLLSEVTSDAEIIDGNILTSTFNKPFTDATLKQKQIFIEIEGFIYEVINIPVTIAGFETNRWKILSNIDLTGKESLINKNVVTIDSNNKISYINGDSFIIEDFDTADVWVVQIGDKYHTIQYTDGDYYIYTDYAFTVNSSYLNYYINYPDSNYNTTVDLTTGNYWTASNVVTNNTGKINPVSFPIFKLKFTDIKYFDETIVETKFANHQYELENSVTQSDEPKMYMTDLSNEYFPKPKVEFVVDNKVTSVPASSHYAANNELFRLITDGTNTLNLNNLWNKNSISVKWGFKNSLSTNEYPYYLNNSFNAEIFNKSANSLLTYPDRTNRNLEYFYTINSSTASWFFHSLHIEEIQNNSIVQDYNFDINQYLNKSYDYFSIFFDRKVYRNNSSIIENISKYSQFNTGDSDTSNITLFNGLKIKAFDVSSIKFSDGLINKINTFNNNTYDDYKFSILLSKNNWTIETDTSNQNILSYTYSTNALQWTIIDTWKLQKEYDAGSIVNYDEILFIALTNSFIQDPTYNPSNSSDWTYSSVNTLFFSPLNTYTTYAGGGTLSNIVYNSGEYYINNGVFLGPNNTFFIPGTIYATGSVIIYQNNVWESTTYPNIYLPTQNFSWQDSLGNSYKYWNQIDFEDSFGSPTTQWDLVRLWDSNSVYFPNSIVVYNNILYYANSVTTIAINPDTTTDWTEMYSFVANTNTIYNSTPDDNNLIFYNNKYYLCTSNLSNSSMDNGIYVFINNVFKNIFINIYINDNTLSNLSNADRDNLYNDLYTSLTANNFINAINDVQGNYGFINKIKYIIINQNSTKVYDFDQVNSFVNLPTILTIDFPDSFNSRLHSLVKTSVTLTPNQLKPTLALNVSQIPTFSKRNYYNSIALANTISKNAIDANVIPNISEIRNEIYNNLYRHSGFYDPIFIDIDIFKKGLTYSTNTIFDTSLTNFGIAKEVILSKVNRNGSQLKLKNTPSLKSIYPMLDEFGYTAKDFFIFKSNWDIEYYYECLPVVISTISDNIVDTPVIYKPIQLPPKNVS
jgi:hypothetical protein